MAEPNRPEPANGLPDPAELCELQTAHPTRESRLRGCNTGAPQRTLSAATLEPPAQCSSTYHPQQDMTVGGVNRYSRITPARYYYLAPIFTKNTTWIPIKK